MQDSIECTTLQVYKKRSCVGVQQKIQASMFWRSRREGGRRSSSRSRRNTAENSLFLCFWNPSSTIFFPLIGHRLRLVKLFMGGVQSLQMHPSSPPDVHGGTRRPPCNNPQLSHPLSLPHLLQVEGSVSGLFVFKNTDDKTHQYSTGGWEGWFEIFLQLT